jgi:hypothetical protein
MGKPAQIQPPTLEQFLANIYVDPIARARFLASPEAEASRAGLSEQQCLKLKDIDRTGLEMASRSLARKRAAHQAASVSSRSGWWLNCRNSFFKWILTRLRGKRGLLRYFVSV